ncbi:phosphohydrolase [Deinococcus fonticola]|uniref:HD domain-containing protein n=1 Tax=Deinococcus fonticola TaxID=2528713 RepID=UPI001F0E9691|nr:phosphohydrolase [Deinococcus fonticola]
MRDLAMSDLSVGESSGEQWRFLQGVRAFALPHYQRSERAYHNDGHVRNLLSVLARHDVLTPTLALAVWGHDLVYDPARNDNEAQSAELFGAWLRQQGASENLCLSVRQLILATRHTSPPASRQEALLVDADLSILGAAPADFQAYEAGIRQEYAHVPEGKYRAGRRQVLEHFLKRDLIYTTPEFIALEKPARHNLQGSLQQLA